MLTFKGAQQKFCDGINRRSFLKIGAFGAGLTLADLLRLRAGAAQNGVASESTGRAKSAIMIYLPGGPSHMDMYDLKPEAPMEYRGEFRPMNTNVAGIQICEHFPQLATMADKYAIIRSLTGMYDDHSNFHTHTGWTRKDLRNVGGRPALGSVVAKMLGPTPSGAMRYGSCWRASTSSGTSASGREYAHTSAASASPASSRTQASCSANPPSPSRCVCARGGQPGSASNAPITVPTTPLRNSEPAEQTTPTSSRPSPLSASAASTTGARISASL